MFFFFWNCHTQKLYRKTSKVDQLLKTIIIIEKKDKNDEITLNFYKKKIIKFLDNNHPNTYIKQNNKKNINDNYDAYMDLLNKKLKLANNNNNNNNDDKDH